jgi:prepilin peptidase CpaA
MTVSSDFSDYVTAGALFAMVVAAAAFDIRSRKIPNWLTLGGMAAGIGLQALLHGLTGFRLSVEGLALGFGVYLAFYCLRAMGAGDVKLMGAVGAFAGPVLWFHVFLATSVAAGILALWLSLAKGRFRQTLWNIGYLILELIHFRPPYYKHPELDVKSGHALKMPHGVAIAAGVTACLAPAGVQLTLFRLLGY